MKAGNLTLFLAMATLSGLGTVRSMADNPTETVLNGKVIDSTFTFSGSSVSGPGNFPLDQTTIANLNSLNPPVTLQLILTSITYTEATVVGNGQVPTITFHLSPTLGNVIGGNLPSTLVTLTAPAIPNGVTENNVIFTLASPLVFAPVAESNPGNTNNGTGTWQESLSNLEPSPDSITTANGSFTPSSVQNQNFTFGGTVEVIYAAPEPSSVLLGFVAVGLFGVLARRREVRA